MSLNKEKCLVNWTDYLSQAFIYNNIFIIEYLNIKITYHLIYLMLMISIHYMLILYVFELSIFVFDELGVASQ